MNTQTIDTRRFPRVLAWCSVDFAHGCGFKTPHVLLDGLYGERGLLWRCERCEKTREMTAYEASLTTRLPDGAALKIRDKVMRVTGEIVDASLLGYSDKPR